MDFTHTSTMKQLVFQENDSFVGTVQFRDIQTIFLCTTRNSCTMFSITLDFVIPTRNNNKV